jgi:hypothetical protein
LVSIWRLIRRLPQYDLPELPQYHLPVCPGISRGATGQAGQAQITQMNKAVELLGYSADKGKDESLIEGLNQIIK